MIIPQVVNIFRKNLKSYCNKLDVNYDFLKNEILTYLKQKQVYNLLNGSKEKGVMGALIYKFGGKDYSEEYISSILKVTSATIRNNIKKIDKLIKTPFDKKYYVDFFGIMDNREQYKTFNEMITSSEGDFNRLYELITSSKLFINFEFKQPKILYINSEDVDEAILLSKEYTLKLDEMLNSSGLYLKLEFRDLDYENNRIKKMQETAANELDIKKIKSLKDNMICFLTDILKDDGSKYEDIIDSELNDSLYLEDVIHSNKGIINVNVNTKFNINESKTAEIEGIVYNIHAKYSEEPGLKIKIERINNKTKEEVMIENLNKKYNLEELKKKDEKKWSYISNLLIDSVKNEKPAMTEDGELLTPKKVRRMIESI